MLVLVVWIAFALVATERRSATTDEFGSVWLAAQPAPRAIVEKAHETDIHPPTPYLILHFWGRLFGYGDIALRIPSLLLVLLSLLPIWKLIESWSPQADDRQRLLAFALCATAPILWVQAGVARYYALGTLAGLLSVYGYVRWLRRMDRTAWVFYLLATAGTFYVHFLLAFLVVVSQCVHYVARGRRTPGTAGTWLAAQVLVLLLAAPIILWGVMPLLTGGSSGLENRAPEGLSGLRAFPFTLAGHAYMTVTGGVPFPWDLWVVGPACLFLAAVILQDLARNRVLLDPDLIHLAAFPFVLLAFLIALILPVAGYFAGVFRAGYAAVLCWLGLSLAVVQCRNDILRRAATTVLLVANLYAMVVYGLDLSSMAQSTPVKPVAARIGAGMAPDSSALVFHPFNHGWGDPLKRYLPGVPCVFIRDGAQDIPLENAVLAVEEAGPAVVWIVQRNRFSRRADEISSWLLEHGYTLSETTGYQPQRACDIRFKNALKRVPWLHLDPAPSQPFYWTLKRFDRLP